eukprot:scaffold6595_cov24-Tisochrysis_lutea.AAC.2
MAGRQRESDGGEGGRRERAFEGSDSAVYSTWEVRRIGGTRSMKKNRLRAGGRGRERGEVNAEERAWCNGRRTPWLTPTPAALCQR